MRSKIAISHLRKTGDIVEAVDIALGRSNPPNLAEAESHQQTQEWFLPNEDALNQFILRLLNRLPDVTYKTEAYSENGKGGYKVVVTGKYADHDLSSLAAVKGGVVRLDNPPANL